MLRKVPDDRDDALGVARRVAAILCTDTRKQLEGYQMKVESVDIRESKAGASLLWEGFDADERVQNGSLELLHTSRDVLVDLTHAAVVVWVTGAREHLAKLFKNGPKVVSRRKLVASEPLLKVVAHASNLELRLLLKLDKLVMPVVTEL